MNVCLFFIFFISKFSKTVITLSDFSCRIKYLSELKCLPKERVLSKEWRPDMVSDKNADENLEEAIFFGNSSRLQPLVVFYEWYKDGNTMRRLTAFILLPSGAIIGELLALVSEDGHFLLVMVA